MQKILMSLVMIALVSATAIGATKASFSDTETSNSNTFTAGTLDLTVDGGNANVVKFTVSNMSVDDQRIGTWRLRNTGSVNGYLDLQNIIVANNEDGCTDSESGAGDSTCTPGAGNGELQNLVSLSKLFWDNNCNGWVDSGEAAVFDGKVGTIASNYETNKALNAGAEQCLTGQFNWWSNGANDNLGQGDSFTMDMTFELAETTAQ